jgi:hypothetical protein
MNYPHWLGMIELGDTTVAVAALARTSGQAECSIRLYAESKGATVGPGELVCYDNKAQMLFATGYKASDVVILTEDDRGKCLAYRASEDPSCPIEVEYFTCGGCFI